MINKKIIIISIIVITVFMILFMYLNKNTQKNTTINTINTGSDVRTTFATENNTKQQTRDTNEGLNTYFNQETNTESFNLNEISESISNWKITKDDNILTEAVIKTNNFDNEAFYYLWVDIIKNNTNEFYLLAEKNLNNKKYIENIQNILSWFIELSGEYEKLDKNKKKQIDNIYSKINNLLK